MSATRKILETGQTEDTFGKNPKGLAMYGSDGHFIVLITYDGRPQPETIEKMTDQQRADLHRMMTSTYTFDGSKVAHHVDIYRVQAANIDHDIDRLRKSFVGMAPHLTAKLS